MQKYLPAGASQGSNAMDHKMHSMNGKTHMQINDPGEILLRTLTGEEGHGMHGGMFPMGPPMGHRPSANHSTRKEKTHRGVMTPRCVPFRRRRRKRGGARCG